MRNIDQIIIHCAATRPSLDIGVEEIREWHVTRGFIDIGYHYVIRRNGVVEEGRPLDQVGAHAEGHNANSIGICLVGGIDEDGKPDANFTYQQYTKLYNLVLDLKDNFRMIDSVIGHRQVSKKACPSFDVINFFN